MTDAPKTKKALIVADFSDAGTGRNYVAGDTPMIEAGAYANYHAAGLVTAPPADKAKPAARPKRAAKAKTPKTQAKPVEETKAPPADVAQPTA